MPAVYTDCIEHGARHIFGNRKDVQVSKLPGLTLTLSHRAVRFLLQAYNQTISAISGTVMPALLIYSKSRHNACRDSDSNSITLLRQVSLFVLQLPKSDVSVFVIDCTDTGAVPPIIRLPARTERVGRLPFHNCLSGIVCHPPLLSKESHYIFKCDSYHNAKQYDYTNEMNISLINRVYRFASDKLY